MINSSTLRRGVGASILTIAAIAAGATSASADSFAYLRAGDIYLTTTDGARQFQVTATGGYSSVAQADDGTLLAVGPANHLQRLDRYGDVLSDAATPVSQNLNGTSVAFDGPSWADVSPDGKTAGYGFLKVGTYQYPDGTRDSDLYNGTGFSHSDALTGFTDAGFKYSRDWDAPEFITNDTVLVSNGPGYPSTPFAIEKVGSGDPQSWFADGDNMHPLEATISRNLRFLAAVHGPDRHSLEVYRDGDQTLLSADLQDCFTYSDSAHPNPQFNSPTFNADGTRLAFGTGNALEIAPVGDGSAGCPAGQNAIDVPGGGSSPDWGPADVPAARPADHPLPGGSHDTPPTTTPAPPVPGPAPGPARHPTSLAVRVGSSKLSAALTHGLTVRVTTTARGAVNVVARSGSHRVAGARASAKAGQTVSLRLTFTEAARRQLRHHKRVVLTLVISQGTAAQTTTVILKS